MTIKFKLKLLLFTIINWLSFGVSDAVYAIVCQPGDTNCATIPNPLGDKASNIAGFINLLLDTIFPIASIVSVFFMIYAGFLMVTAGDNEEKLEKAKTAFLWTVIGIAILLGAKVFSAVVCGTINQLLSDPARLSCPIP